MIMIKTKSLSALLGLLITVSGTYGQANKFEIGIEGGPNVTFRRSSAAANKNGTKASGLSGAFFFQFNFKKIISVRTNIACCQERHVFTTAVTDIYGNTLGEVT